MVFLGSGVGKPPFRVPIHGSLQVSQKVQKEYNPKTATKEWLDRIILSNYMGGDVYIPGTLMPAVEERNTLCEWIDHYFETEEVSLDERKHLKVIQRCLQRYEAYMKLSRKKVGSYRLFVETLTSDDLESLRDYFINEYKYVERFPRLLEYIYERKVPNKRSENTAIITFKRLRKVIYWCERKGVKTQNPFRNFVVGVEKFGTPFYLTIEERNAIYNKDMSSRPSLAVQRDVFIFQCLIGCRVSDLCRLTKSNVIDGAIEYVAQKTRNESPVTIRVPLNSQAFEIIRRYESIDCNGKLLPMIFVQKYNDAIKDVFTFCGITRNVLILDSVTRTEMARPLNEVASSHIARRTFAGNLYKKVKDPNLVCALTGHKEGSKAFTRYRTIDDDMKKELISLLD